MNSNLILKFIYELTNDGIKIWAQDSNIKISVPNDLTLTDFQKDFIRVNKEEILYYLHVHKVYSQEYDVLIFRNESNKTILSFAQERLWFLEKYEQGTNAYNMPMVFKLSQNTQPDILKSSIRSIIIRHESLRTLIKEDIDGNSYQLILDSNEYFFEIPTIKVTDYSQLDQELRIRLNSVYDLSNEFPIRICLYEVINTSGKDNTEYYLSIVVHHIAFDGWSADIFLKELEWYYNYYLEQLKGLEVHLNLQALSIQYKDFTLWQRYYLSGKRLNKQLNYWKDKLSGYETLGLISDHQRPNQIDYKGSDIYFELDENTSISLRELAKELNVTLYSLLLSGYYLMLKSYSNQNDIVVGIPIANRHYSQISNLIGLFVNSLAIRVQINTVDSLKDFIQSVGHSIVEAQLYQDLPFEKLVEELKVPIDTSKHPIFQVLFGVQGFGESTISDLLQPYELARNLYKVAKFDISTFIEDRDTRIKGTFNYATSLYRESTIAGFINTYINILQQFTQLANDLKKQEQVKIHNLAYLAEQQQNLIINQWNKTYKYYSHNKTIHQLFEEQAVKTPDNIAIVCKDIKLTYQELNTRANQLANYLLITYDIKPDSLIMLFLERSEYILIGVLAVLKTGAAYVPIDTSSTEERVHYQLEDTKAKIILTSEIHEKRLKNIIAQLSTDSKTNIVGIDSFNMQGQLVLQSNANPYRAVTSANLAYVIYTSGTTGKPKGVMIEHKSFIAVLDSIKNLYFIDRKKISTYNITSYVFDIFGLEYGLPLLTGGIICIGYNEFDFLDCSEFDFIQMTPTLCELKLNCLHNTSRIKLLIGGENLSSNLLNKILSKFINVVNVYGPTETTIWSTSKSYLTEENTNILTVSLGTPLHNETVYVLDTDLNPLPIGAVGELYIGGIGVARGYLNKPKLTVERFIENPFLTKQEKTQGNNTKLYKTGDLVRWLPDGNLEYLGRSDLQVKIRGHRVELEEIENALRSYDGIKQSVVVVIERKTIDGSSNDYKQLVGYYVSKDKLDEKDILNYLVSKIPRYMVPNVLVSLKKLPLTINGKLDRKALPEPEFTGNDDYVAASTVIEAQLTGIWSDILGLPKDKIGIYDSFFDLGGHSLLLMNLHSRLQKEFDKQFPMVELFRYSTIESLCDYLTTET